MADGSDTSTGLLVTGDPDVGKSAITLATADDLVSEGGAIHLVHLRDRPRLTMELDHLVGGPVAEVPAAGPVAPARLLVVDGAEAVLEGWSTMFADLAAAAVAAGVRIVAVARRDTATAVATSLSTDGQTANTFVVPQFDAEQRMEVVASFPSLSRFSTDPRSGSVLGRPGLLDLLLRARA